MPAIGAMGGGSLGNAWITVGAKVAPLVSGMAAATASVQKFGKAAIAIYAVATAIKATTKEYIDFDKQLKNTHTLISATSAQMDKIGASVRSMARQYQVGSTEAQAALYQIYSSTIYGADAMKVLEESTKGAAAGLSSLFTTADMMTTVLNAYGKDASEAAHINDLLFTTVKYGKTTMSELASQFGRLSGVAAPLGASVSDMTAAIATLTRQGIRTDWAITSLRQTLMQFIKPVKNLKAAIKDLGFSSGTAIIKELGFAKALKMVTEYAKKNNIEMSEMFTNVRAITAVLPLATTAAAGYSTDLVRMSNSSGAATEAFNKQTKSMSFQIEKFTTLISDMSISLGRVLAPSLQVIIGVLSKLTSIVRVVFDVLTMISGGFILAIVVNVGILAAAVKGLSTAFMLMENDIIRTAGLKMAFGFDAATKSIKRLFGTMAVASPMLRKFTGGMNYLGQSRNPVGALGAGGVGIGGQFGKAQSLRPMAVGMASAAAVLAGTAFTVKQVMEIEVDPVIKLGKVQGVDTFKKAIANSLDNTLGGILGGAVTGALIGGQIGGAHGAALGALGGAVVAGVGITIKIVHDIVSAQAALDAPRVEELKAKFFADFEFPESGVRTFGLVSDFLDSMNNVPSSAFQEIRKSLDELYETDWNPLHGGGAKLQEDSALIKNAIGSMSLAIAADAENIMASAEEGYRAAGLSKLTGGFVPTENELLSMSDDDMVAWGNSIRSIMKDTIDDEQLGLWMATVLQVSIDNAIAALERNEDVDVAGITAAIDAALAMPTSNVSDLRKRRQAIKDAVEPLAGEDIIPAEVFSLIRENYNKFGTEIIGSILEGLGMSREDYAGWEATAATTDAVPQIALDGLFDNFMPELEPNLLGGLTKEFYELYDSLMDVDTEASALPGILDKMGTSLEGAKKGVIALEASERISAATAKKYNRILRTLELSTKKATDTWEYQIDTLIEKMDLSTNSAKDAAEAQTSLIALYKNLKDLVGTTGDADIDAALTIALEKIENSAIDLSSVLTPTAFEFDRLAEKLRSATSTGKEQADSIVALVSLYNSSIETQKLLQDELGKTDSELKYVIDGIRNLGLEISALDLSFGEKLSLSGLGTITTTINEEFAEIQKYETKFSEALDAITNIEDYLPSNASIREAMDMVFGGEGEFADGLRASLEESGGLALGDLAGYYQKIIDMQGNIRSMIEMIDTLNLLTESLGRTEFSDAAKERILGMYSELVDGVSIYLDAELEAQRRLEEAARKAEWVNSIIEGLAQIGTAIYNTTPGSEGDYGNTGRSVISGLGSIATAAAAGFAVGGPAGAAIGAITAGITAVADVISNVITDTANSIKELKEMVLNTLSTAFIALIDKTYELASSFVKLFTATENYSNLQEVLVGIQGMLFNAMTGFLSLIWGVLRIFIGEVEDMSSYTSDVASEMQKTEESLNDLNIPIGWKVDRIRYKASVPGQPPITDEDEATADETSILENIMEGEAKWLFALMERFGNSIKEVAEKFNEFLEIMGSVWTSLGELVIPAVLASLGTFADGLIELADHIKTDLLPIFSEHMPSIIKNGLDFFFAAITGIATTFVDVLAGILPNLDILFGVIGDIGGQLAGVFEAVTQALTPVINSLIEHVFTPLAEFIRDTLLPDFEKFLIGFGKWWKTDMEPFLKSDAFKKLGEIASDLWGIFKDIVDMIAPHIVPLLSMAAELIAEMWVKLEPVLRDLLQFISDNWQTISGFLMRELEKWLGDLVGKAERFERLAESFLWLKVRIENLKIAMENLGIWVYNLFHKDDKPYIEYIDNINSMGSAASNVAAALDETAGSINDVTDGINNALDDINTVGGGGSGSGSGGGGGDDQGGGGSGSNNIEWGSLENIYYSTALQGISMSIADIFRAAGYNAGSAWSMVDAYGSQGAFNWVNRNYLPNLDIGGTVMDSGIARVKQGEVWYNPAVGRPYGMDNNGMTVITTVNMNGEEIARQTDIYKSGQNALTSGTALPGGL